MPLTGGNGWAAAFKRTGQIEAAVAARVDGSCDVAAVEDTTEPRDAVELPDIDVCAEVTVVGDTGELNAAEVVGTVLPEAAGGLTR